MEEFRHFQSYLVATVSCPGSAASLWEKPSPTSLIKLTLIVWLSHFCRSQMCCLDTGTGFTAVLRLSVTLHVFISEGDTFQVTQAQRKAIVGG